MHKVLLLEDDPTLEPIFATLLHSLDSKIELQTVTNGEDALELLEKAQLIESGKPYSLVIADIFLEGKITGLDFWKLCQKIYPKMPMLVTSSLPFELLTEFLQTQPAPLFLSKPIDPLKCREAIKNALD